MADDGAGPSQRLATDNSGNESEPTFLEIVVTDNERPTAVLDLLNANGHRIATGQTAIFSAARSSDVEPGRVVKYRFTMVDRG